MGYSPEGNYGHFGVVIHSNETITIFTPRGSKFPLDSSGKPILVTEEVAAANTRALPLPLAGTSGEVVGWGARSIAVRRELPKNNYVVVVKPLQSLDEFPVEDDPHMNIGDKDSIGLALQNHLHKSDYVLSDGLGGKPALLKISKEINGPPLAEYPLLLLLSDEAIISNLIQLYDDVLKLAKNKGVLVDLWGSLGSSLLGRIKNNILPTTLRNVMVEYPSMSLPIVDVSAIPIYTRYDTASNKQKAILYARTMSLKIANIFLKNWTKVVNLRNQVFPEPAPNESLDNEFYTGFANGMSIINQSKIDYRVVGSMAVAGLLNAKGVQFVPGAVRPDGTIRDVDVLCFAPEEEVLSLQRKLDLLRSTHPYYPHVTLAPVPGKPIKAWWGLVDLPTNELDENRNYFKQYSDKRVTYTQDEIRPTLVNLQGVNFNTMQPTAIAASYLTRTGIIKPKDLAKVRLLCSTYNIEIPAKYIDFARAIQNQYGFYQNFFIFRTFIDFWTNGKLVKLSNQIRYFLNNKPKLKT